MVIMIESPNEHELLKAIKLTKDNYFKNIVNEKGKFIYSYLPRKNEVERRYNILRHAGTIYSMLEIYELIPDADLLTEAKTAISYLIDRIKPVTIKGVESHVVVERDINKLGGNALAIVALAKYTKVTGDKQYLEIMKSLATWIKEVQDETGQFTIHKQHYSNGEVTSFISRFYPGEAILALVRLYELDNNEDWLDIAEKATSYLIKIRDKDTTLKDITPDHWLLYAINDLYRKRPKDYYLQHAFFMCEKIFSIQIKENAKKPEWIGGYIVSNPPPKSTQAACYSEGLGATFKLAYDFGYRRQAKQIKDVIGSGIAFQLRSQITPDVIKDKELLTPYLGAFQKSITQTGIRIDYTQHNISSLILYHDILKNKKFTIRTFLKSIFKK